jgi:hypothetical protein
MNRLFQVVDGAVVVVDDLADPRARQREDRFRLAVEIALRKYPPQDRRRRGVVRMVEIKLKHLKDPSFDRMFEQRI